MHSVRIDAGEGLAALGEVAVWSFELDAWGECAQASSESEALRAFSRRTGEGRLEVVERITGRAQVFAPDLLAATEQQVSRTIAICAGSRRGTLALVRLAADQGVLDAEDDAVAQPAWMTWRTPRAIALHLVEDAASGYLRLLGLPLREPDGDLLIDLAESGEHVGRVLAGMPRDLVRVHRGETWTTVKLLRRQAWHERVEQVFLRRRLRAAGVPAAAVAAAQDSRSQSAR